MNIDQYMDKAIKIQGFKSDKDISRSIGKSMALASQWRTKRAWPSDDAMIKLAEMAGESPEKALLDLNIWRSEGAARSIYEKLASRTIQGVAILGVSSLAAFGFQPKPAEALTILEKVETQSANNLYYGKLIIYNRSYRSYI
ncbi:hypothetical protein [Kiloniella majae]|uniref:hypothetical protein n=1 Tax=Kiloniella majae TaxID=1938558 RepID=UPI000A27869C|nr:hypothetical protein [Kiloniella majae]